MTGNYIIFCIKFRLYHDTLERKDYATCQWYYNLRDIVIILSVWRLIIFAELTKTFYVHRITVWRQLEAIGFTRKLDSWVPHQLTAGQRDQWIANLTCFLTFPIHIWTTLEKIVTVDEKGGMYCNVKNWRTVCRPSDLDASTSKTRSSSRKCFV